MALLLDIFLLATISDNLKRTDVNWKWVATAKMLRPKASLSSNYKERSASIGMFGYGLKIQFERGTNKFTWYLKKV